MIKIICKKVIVLLICVAGLTLSGCEKREYSVKKEYDLDFTIVEQTEIPKKLSEKISERKENEFQITYKDGEYMYIAIGYGVQDTGGYSVNIKELYVAQNAIYINSSLIGPRENDLVLKAKSYPYVVVKLENRDMNVVFF